MWLLYSQLSALAETASTLLAKKSMEHYDSTVVTWFWVTSSLLLLGLFLWFTGIPSIQPLFFTILGARIILDTAALLLYTKALHLEEVSLITPLFNLSAIFSLFFSYLINQEIPSVLGILGVLIIVVGAYLLNYESKNANVLHPLVNIFKKKASRYMIISTLLYGAIFSISKLGIETSSIAFYTFASALGLSFTIFPIAYYSNKKDLVKILQLKNAIRVMPLGLIDGIKILALMATINTSYVSFADASNNTSILYSQVLGKVFLKEKIRQRFGPAALMFLGLLIIVFFS